MNFVAVLILLVIAYFTLTIIGGLFIGVVGFVFDNFFLAFAGLALLVFLFGKK